MLRASYTGQAEQRVESVVPFTYEPLTHPNNILIQMSINASPPMPFLFDTATFGPLWLARWVVEQMRLPVKQIFYSQDNLRSTSVVALEAADLLLAGGRTVRLSVSEAGLYDGDPTIPDEYPKQFRIAGILGASILAWSKVRFDWAKKQITVAIGEYSPPAKPLAVIPVHPSDIPADYRFSIEVKLPGCGTQRLMVDTSLGSPIMLFPDAGKRLKVNRVSPFPHTAYIEGRAYPVKRVLVDSIDIGSLKLNNVWVDVLSILTKSPISKDVTGLVGLPVLSKFVFTIEHQNLRMILEAWANSDKNIPVPGQTGIMDVQSAPEGAVVKQVAFGSPAYAVGVREGDIITQVDNTSLKGVPRNPALRLIGGWGGTTAKMEIVRNGKTMTMMLRRRGEFE